MTDWQTDLAARAPELRRAAATLRDTVVLGYGTHALLKAGRMHGCQFESLGADRFVEAVGIFLADHRDIFNDRPRRAKLVECLDAFVEAGGPKARRLLRIL